MFYSHPHTILIEIVNSSSPCHLSPQAWWVLDVAWTTRRALACWWKMRHSLNNTLRQKHSHHVCTRVRTHRKTNNTSPLVLYEVISMYVDIIGDNYGVCCTAEAVQTSHCILDRFFPHKIIVPILFFQLILFVAGVQNNEYHHIRFHCTEIDSGVIHSMAKQGQLHIQYCMLFLKIQKWLGIRCTYIYSPVKNLTIFLNNNVKDNLS